MSLGPINDPKFRFNHFNAITLKLQSRPIRRVESLKKVVASFYVLHANNYYPLKWWLLYVKYIWALFHRKWRCENVHRTHLKQSKIVWSLYAFWTNPHKVTSWSKALLADIGRRILKRFPEVR